MEKAVFLFFFIAMLSCTKSGSDNKNDITCTNYEKGNVIVGIKNTASIEDVFFLFNKLGLQIDRMSGFFYTSPYPKDSLASLISYLSTKSYINAGNFTANAFVNYQTGVIHVITFFFDMNFTNQQDWINTKKSLKLVDMQDDTKNILLKVPFGQEKYWLNTLKQNSIVTWTELNCIVQIQPL